MNNILVLQKDLYQLSPGKMRQLFFFCLLSLSIPLFAQPRTDQLLTSIIQNDTSIALKRVVADVAKYRVQIIYTQINRDQQNRPHFRNYYFNYDPKLYFNPASMVKLPLAALSLEKLTALRQPGVNKQTRMAIDSSFPGQNVRFTDSTSASGYPSLAQFIRKAFLVSDNDAYNRMYQFLGQEYLHKKLWEKGYTSIRMPRQFRGYSFEQNRQSNQVRFLDEKGNELYRQPAAYNPHPLTFTEVIKLGEGYYDRNDSLVHQPMDFSMQNNIPLEDFQQILQSIVFPSSVKRKQRFNFSNADQQFLLQYLSQFPSETNYPKYDSSKFYDSYLKFFFRNPVTKRLPGDVRVFNKVGWSYGFLTDVSYVVDFANGVEYMLAATIYVNSDGILNDDKYDYDAVGYPFFYAVGQAIHQYEIHRHRKKIPDLNNLRVIYERRDPRDQRPQVKLVDN
ncbi:MAG: hypothetical protein JWQ27_577 [Ferruginibacter sp.]|nr:hypothetical protein [Ferruginibacter sp.]